MTKVVIFPCSYQVSNGCSVSELSSGPTAALSREDPILTSDSSQDVPDSSSVNSSPVKAQLKTLGLKKKPSQDSINTDVKPTRWKRRKLHEQNVSSGPSDVVESESRKSDSVVSAKAENDGAKEVIDSKNPGLAVLETWDSSKSVPTKRRISDEKPDDADRYVFPDSLMENCYILEFLVCLFLEEKR